MAPVRANVGAIPFSALEACVGRSTCLGVLLYGPPDGFGAAPLPRPSALTLDSGRVILLLPATIHDESGVAAGPRLFACPHPSGNGYTAIVHMGGRWPATASLCGGPPTLVPCDWLKSLPEGSPLTTSASCTFPLGTLIAHSEDVTHVLAPDTTPGVLTRALRDGKVALVVSSAPRNFDVDGWDDTLRAVGMEAVGEVEGAPRSGEEAGWLLLAARGTESAGWANGWEGLDEAGVAALTASAADLSASPGAPLLTFSPCEEWPATWRDGVCGAVDSWDAADYLLALRPVLLLGAWHGYRVHLPPMRARGRSGRRS